MCYLVKDEHCSGQVGAVLVEAAIVAPIVLLFSLFIIEYSLIVSETTVLDNAVADAGKFGAIQYQDCLNQAILKLVDELETFGWDSNDLDTSASSYAIVTSGSSPMVPALKLVLETNIPCLLCQLGFWSGVNYRREHVFAVEHPQRCQ